jgi:excisionase family DNA binding protein
MEKILLTRKEAAHLLSISVDTLDRYIVLKEIPARRVGRRVMIHRQDLERFARHDHGNAYISMEAATA